MIKFDRPGTQGMTAQRGEIRWSEDTACEDNLSNSFPPSPSSAVQMADILPNHKNRMFLGQTLGNYVILEYLLPNYAYEWKEEDAVLCTLINDHELRTGLVGILETMMGPNHRTFYLHHHALLIPLWYNWGEDSEQFKAHIRRHFETGLQLGMVRRTLLLKRRVHNSLHQQSLTLGTIKSMGLQLS